jgi:hypothetical protein
MDLSAFQELVTRILDLTLHRADYRAFWTVRHLGSETLDGQ